jgi:hydroxymethylbilane synthase
MRRIRVGTRRSRLATIQTESVVELIRARFRDVTVELVPTTTLGDRLPPERRAEAQGKAAFTEEIEVLLQKGEIDIAVHSMKDLPVTLPHGLMIGATPVRADPRDALVSNDGRSTMATLGRGAVLGTSSVRRKAQLRAIRKDISPVDLHGNVDTRLVRMGENHLDGIVVAVAGLERLGESARITQRFSVNEMVPAPCQGAIAVEMREGDDETFEVLSAVDDTRVRTETSCELSFARTIGGDCDLPAGACATLVDGRLTLVGVILSADGGTVVKRSAVSTASGAAGLGSRLASELLDDGGSEILRDEKR